MVTDLRSWPAWWPAIRDAEPIAGGHERPEAIRLTFATPSPLRPLRVTLTVLERGPAHRLVAGLTDGPLRGGGTVTVRPAPEGSEASYDLQLRVASLLFRPLEPVLASATRASGQARLRQAGEELARLAGGELVKAPSR